MDDCSVCLFGQSKDVCLFIYFFITMIVGLDVYEIWMIVGFAFL